MKFDKIEMILSNMGLGFEDGKILIFFYLHFAGYQWTILVAITVH